jgi:cbb3-type cytochrome oxidase maturation protein
MENYWGVALVVLVCLLFGLGAGIAFWWAGRSGQFENIEGVKHRMLEHESEEGHKMTKEPVCEMENRERRSTR